MIESRSIAPEEMALAHLIWSAEQLTPSEHNRLAFKRISDDRKQDGSDVRAQCRAVVGALYDGLSYGNWPK